MAAWQEVSSVLLEIPNVVALLYLSLKKATNASSTSASATSGFSATKVCWRTSCKAWWLRTEFLTA